MNILKTDIRSGGFDLRQVWRDGDIAVYRQTKPGHVAETFETIRVQHHKAFELHGNHIETGEHYPASETWGRHGFTFPTEERAIERARAMRDA